MGRIVLATSPTTDEEYGGTFATHATDVAYDNTSSGLTADDVQEAIDEVNGIQSTNIGITWSNGFTEAKKRINKQGDLVVAQLEFYWSSPNFNETHAANFTNFNIGDYICGIIVDSGTATAGAFILTGSRLYIRLNSSTVTSQTKLCLTIVGFNFA